MLEAGRGGVVLERRRERSFDPEPTLPATHQLTIGGAFASRRLRREAAGGP